ncbi:sulfatase family protein [Tichowtungia aerotolerans]|uniref:Sulfatase-like hydrolase/transferase n=1 Tax=Tichowtungia aerotolerans TaxID=2697043 RepID=A0A6P1M5U7_9BACT|nr:sulfatase-like hydrolase/transferase [Tichowtungia aerotolerans]QHI68373.1 sulfatase-like hydrolase/transferase [Tichowtungia aerotolerans]
MKKFDIPLIAAAIILSGLIPAAATNHDVSSARPNVVLIIGDDVGYGDLSCYGYDNLVPTPNLDRLAAEGVRFTDAYVTSPVCGPTRYALLSGAYSQRFGVQWNTDCWSKLPGLEETLDNHRVPPTQKLLHETLTDAGYATGLVGHWGLPCYPQTTHDETKSIVHYMAHYWPDETGHYLGVNEPIAISPRKRVIWGPEREGDEYFTDRLGRQSVEFIEKHAGEPFYLNLAFTAPHSPMQAKKVHQDAVKHLPSEALRLYGAMLISMDENVGKVLDALDKNGLAENTIVIFFSDNGPSPAFNEDWPEEWSRDVVLGTAGPLRDTKGTFYEGGIKIPYIIRWPAGLEKGQVYEKTISSLDIYPTVCNAANASVSETTRLDGVDLMPYLTGKKTDTPNKTLFWWGGSKGGAVKDGKWKLWIGPGGGGERKLFNLEEDLGETTDLCKIHPEIVASLEVKFSDFCAQMPPPLNPKK